MKDIFNLEPVHSRRTTYVVYTLFKFAIVFSIAWLSLVLVPQSKRAEAAQQPPALIEDAGKPQTDPHSLFENAGFSLQFADLDPISLELMNSTNTTTNTSDTHSFFAYGDRSTLSQIFGKIQHVSNPKKLVETSPCLSFFIEAQNKSSTEDEVELVELDNQMKCEGAEEGSPQNGVQFVQWKYETVDLKGVNCAANSSNCEKTCKESYNGRHIEGQNTCRMLYVADEICLKVKVHGDDDAELQGGCYEGGKSYVKYRKLGPNQRYSFGGLKIVVRNAEDELLSSPRVRRPTYSLVTGIDNQVLLTWLRWLFGAAAVVLLVAVGVVVAILKIREHRHHLILSNKSHVSELPEVQFDDRQPTFAN